MENNWQKIWDNKKSQLDEINANDEQKIIFELKRLAGWDGFGTGASIAFSEIKKEYEYLRDNLKTGGGLYLN